MYTNEKNIVETSSLSARTHPEPSGTPPDTPTLTRSNSIEMVEVVVNHTPDRATVVCKAAETTIVGSSDGSAIETYNNSSLLPSSLSATCIKESGNSESNNTNNCGDKKQTLGTKDDKAAERELRENNQSLEYVLENENRNNEENSNGDLIMEDVDALAAASLLTFARGDGTSSPGEEEKESDSLRLTMTESLIQSPSSSVEPSASEEVTVSESSAKVSSVPDVFTSKQSTPESPLVDVSRQQSPNKTFDISLKATASSCIPMTPEGPDNTLPSITVASAKVSRGRPRGKGVGTSRKPKFKYQKSACMACHKAHMACKERDNPNGCFECRTLRKGRECVPRADGRKNRRRNKSKALDCVDAAKQNLKAVKRRRRSVVTSKKETPAIGPKEIDVDSAMSTPKSTTESIADTTSSTPEALSVKRRRLNTDIEDLIAENTLAPCTPESRENPTTITLPSIQEVFGGRRNFVVDKGTLQAQIDELRDMTNLLASILQNKEKEEREKERSV